MSMPNNMHTRLKMARLKAGFKSAAKAIETFGWRGSTYRAHESGQNMYNIPIATKYADAFNTSVEWLLCGKEPFSLNASNPISSGETIQNDSFKNESVYWVFDNINQLIQIIKNDNNPHLIRLLMQNVKYYEMLVIKNNAEH